MGMATATRNRLGRLLPEAHKAARTLKGETGLSIGMIYSRAVLALVRLPRDERNAVLLPSSDSNGTAPGADSIPSAPNTTARTTAPTADPSA